MTDQDPQPGSPATTSPDRHDTAAYLRPAPGGPAAGAGYPPGPPSGWYVPTPAEADAQRWAARYRRQRTITAVLGVGLAVALAALVGLGALTWQVARSTPLLDVSDLASGLGGDAEGLVPEGLEGLEELVPDPQPDDPAPDDPGSALEDLLPEGLLPEGLLPEGLLPEGLLPEGLLPQDQDGSEGTPPDLDDVPLPEPLSGLGSMLGITDVGELLDLAVANGLISQEAADDLRRAIAAGSALDGSGGQEGTGVS